jgi:hypothetical protein
MKKIILLLLFFGKMISMDAQMVTPKLINSTGGSAMTGGIILEWNVGEIATTTLSNGSMLTQGLLQPLAIANAPLPVKLLYFKATLVNGAVQLEWKTSQEVNNDHFDIERSSDGVQFTFLKKINGNGTTAHPQEYSASDPSPFNTITYYRLKQVDGSDAFIYSGIVSIKITAAGLYRLFPNPASAFLIIDRAVTGPCLIEILDASGKPVRKDSFQAMQTRKNINLQNLSKGIYFIKLTQENNQWIQQVIRQ